MSDSGEVGDRRSRSRSPCRSSRAFDSLCATDGGSFDLLEEEEEEEKEEGEKEEEPANEEQDGDEP
eukprot:11893498-Alexandrium_andersonii.AAC.1